MSNLALPTKIESLWALGRRRRIEFHPPCKIPPLPQGCDLHSLTFGTAFLRLWIVHESFSPVPQGAPIPEYDPARDCRPDDQVDQAIAAYKKVFWDPFGRVPSDVPAGYRDMPAALTSWSEYFLHAQAAGEVVTIGTIRTLNRETLHLWPLPLLYAFIHARIDIDKYTEVECHWRPIEIDGLVDVGIYVSRTGMTFREAKDGSFFVTRQCG